jgi:cyclohexadienyl dehydratase
VKGHLLWILLLLACAGADADRPVLRVGTSGDYSPFSYRDDAGRRNGFDVALARAYARERGLALRWVPMRWTTLEADLGVGRFDVVMSGVTVRPERSLSGRFSLPVANSGAVLLTRGLDELPLDERARIVVNAGGHLERVARRLFPHAALRALTPNAAVRDALLTGAADAAVTDTLEAPGWLAGTSGLRAFGPLTRDVKACWLPADANERARDLDAWLLAREADGTLAALRAEHLPGAQAPMATALGALTAAIEERLSLMPLVAEAKRATGSPVRAPAQEGAVIATALAMVRENAALQGVAAPGDAAVREFFEALMAAAREVQAATLARPAAGGAAPDLEHELRPALARISQRIAWLLVQLPQQIDSAQAKDAVGQIEAEGLDAQTRERLAHALLAFGA